MAPQQHYYRIKVTMKHHDEHSHEQPIERIVPGAHALDAILRGLEQQFESSSLEDVQGIQAEQLEALYLHQESMQAYGSIPVIVGGEQQ